jgi:hypothetical protein
MSDSNGFDSSSFAAKMSSIGHSGNISGGAGAPGLTIGEFKGALSHEIGTNSGDIVQTLENVGNSSTLQVFPVFKLISSLIEGAKIVTIDPLLQSLGIFQAPITPLKLPNPSQLFVSGGKEK